MWRVELTGPLDWDGFREAVKALVAAGIAPTSVRFCTPQSATEPATASLFAEPVFEVPSRPPPLSLPAGFVTLCRQVLMHDDPARFERLYALAWRIAQDRAHWDDPLAPDRRVLDGMARTVGREIHKMKAFVRFRPLPGPAGEPLRQVAWFEPAHHVVEAVAPFFVRRFPNLHWALLTPRGSVHWNRERLTFAGPARAEEAPPPDAGEQLWLAYYRSIFNPARLKVAMMKREMPVRYWQHLPEAGQIPSLVQEASQRLWSMVEAGPTERTRRRGQAHRAPTPPPTDPVTLRRLAERCEACPLGACATQLVWGEGPVGAQLMLVGEQPGDREDLEGRPFVGPAGQVLRRAIDRLGWPVERLYLTNAVKHFKFDWRGKRRLHKTPGQREAEACAQWLEAEIGSVRPVALVALGATAARALLDRDIAIQEAAGRWFIRERDGRSVWVVPHPASLLRAEGGATPQAVARWEQCLAGAATAWQSPTTA